LTPLSFCVSFAFCTIAVGGAERKKGTAKAVSSHRIPKKADRQWGTKLVTLQGYIVFGGAALRDMARRQPIVTCPSPHLGDNPMPAAH
jgi:hypothetical protein